LDLQARYLKCWDKPSFSRLGLVIRLAEVDFSRQSDHLTFWVQDLPSVLHAANFTNVHAQLGVPFASVKAA
jgi:hypothetical protein